MVNIHRFRGKQSKVKPLYERLGKVGKRLSVQELRRQGRQKQILAQEEDQEEGLEDVSAGKDEFSNAEDAFKVLNESGLNAYVRSAVGLNLKTDNYTNCLKRGVSLAQFIYEKVKCCSCRYEKV